MIKNILADKLPWIYVNPFTSYLLFNSLTIYEFKSDSVFISSDELIADFSVYKLFDKTYEISSITFNKPRFTVIQNQTEFILIALLINLFQKKKLIPLKNLFMLVC